jgi:uracil phosphoribosyltransferase
MMIRVLLRLLMRLVRGRISTGDAGASTEEAERETGIAMTVVTAAVDERLDERKFIVPGLGDAGDRLFGVVG